MIFSQSMGRKFSPLSILVLLLIPLLLFGAQFLFTTTSTAQLRWEETGTGIRKPYWFARREINSGIDSNIGFDGILAVTYTIFGVDLFTGKYLRLALQLISLFSLAFLLRKYLGEKLSLVPLITIGLSPTLLFFVSFQQQYGFDLQYLPIILALLSTINFDVRWFDFLKQFLLWSLAMIAWMSYPTVIFILPAIFLLYFLKLKNCKSKLVNIAVALFSFLWPLVLGFIWIQNRKLLIFDPATETGIFRGGGGKFFQEGTLDLNISNLFSDLFSKGVSYNFDVIHSEFSLIFPILTLILTLATGLYLSSKKSKFKPICLSAWLTLVVSSVIYLATSDPTGMPGLRRVTGSLAAFYSLFTISWYFIWTSKKLKIKWLLIGVLLLLPVHHLLVFYANLEGLKTPSKYQEIILFSDPSLTPYNQYQNWIQQIQQKDVYLSCQTDQAGSVCRYSDLYSIMASACMWNHLKCHEIFGQDPNTNKFIPLNRDLWNSGYLER